MFGWGGVLGVVSGPNSVAVGVYGGGSALAGLVFGGPTTLSEGLSKFSNGFCDFSVAMVLRLLRCRRLIENKHILRRAIGSYRKS